MCLGLHEQLLLAYKLYSTNLVHVMQTNEENRKAMCPSHVFLEKEILAVGVGVF